MPTSAEHPSLVGRYAVISRHRPPDDPERVSLGQELNAQRIERAIRDNVDRAPSINSEQRAALAALVLSMKPPG